MIKKGFLSMLLIVGVCLSCHSQRLLPSSQGKMDLESDDVVGTWKWFCGSVVTVTDNGEVRAVWDDGKNADGRFDKIGDNKYRFIWGNNESIDILKIKKEGNLLEGQNQAGSKVTAIKISSTPGIVGNQKGTSDQFLLNAMKTMQTTQDYKKFIGEWKMSSWNGHYRLLGDGSCIIDNDPSHPSKGIWFLAFDRLYLVWGMMSDTDVFKLNPDQSMKLKRIDNRSAANVTFEKLQAMNAPSNKRTSYKPIIRRRIRVPQNPGEPVKEVERTKQVALFNGHSYKFIPTKMSWKNAKKEAEGMGGYLVCIADQAEDEFVLQLIRDANNGEVPHVWIGLTDDANEGDFKWVNGDKTVYWRNSPNKFLPSDVGEEDFVHYYAAPVGAQEVNWNDNTGNCEFAYVIESDQERPEIVPARPIKDVEVQESEFRYENHTYKFVPKKESWLRAKKNAEKMGGYLVAINSEEEEKYIENKIQEYLGASSEGVWIGLNDIDEEGKWCWVNGDKLTYTKWHEGEPNNNGGLPESCVVINKRNDYGWNDHAMDGEFRYLVEIDY